MKTACKDKVRCYPHGECPLKDKCLWRDVAHKAEACADVEKFEYRADNVEMMYIKGKEVYVLWNDMISFIFPMFNISRLSNRSGEYMQSQYAQDASILYSEMQDEVGDDAVDPPYFEVINGDVYIDFVLAGTCLNWLGIKHANDIVLSIFHAKNGMLDEGFESIANAKGYIDLSGQSFPLLT